MSDIKPQRRKTKHEENRIFTVNDPSAPRLCPELASEIGLNESILFLQLEFWIATGNHIYEDRKWTYQSTGDLQAYFSFWGRATINRTIQSLEQKGLITIGNFNTRKQDKTRWFAINMIQASKLKSIKVEGVEIATPPAQNEPGSAQIEPTSAQFGTAPAQNGTAPAQFGTTLPESSTEKTTEKYDDDAREDFANRNPALVPQAPNPDPSQMEPFPPKKWAGRDPRRPFGGEPKDDDERFHSPHYFAVLEACKLIPETVGYSPTIDRQAAFVAVDLQDRFTPDQIRTAGASWYMPKAPMPKQLAAEILRLIPQEKPDATTNTPAPGSASAIRAARRARQNAAAQGETGGVLQQPGSG